MSDLSMTTTTVSIPDPGSSAATQPSSTPAAPGAAAPAGDRPAWLPEKFKTPEDLAKSYKELESRLGKQPTTTPASTTPASPGAAALTVTPPPPPKQTTSQLLDNAFREAESSETKTLSEATYTALAAQGFDKQAVDRSIAGTRAVVAQQRTEVFDAVGGKDNYTAIKAWAAANLSKDEQTAYDAIIGSGNLNAMKVAAAGLAARHALSAGVEGTRVGGAPAGKGDAGTKPFASTAEQTAAINDPRYRKDPAYRKSVEQRIMATT